MLPTTVRLTIDPSELARVDDALGANARRKVERRSLVVTVWSAVFYLVAAAIEIAFVHRTFLSGVITFGLVGGALLNLKQAVFAFRRIRERARAVVRTDTDVTIADSGLTLHPSERTLPWASIAEVRDVDGYFAFVGPNRTSEATVRKTDLHDGRDFWAALDDRFVAKRYLVRGTLSSVRIGVNAGATPATAILG